MFFYLFILSLFLIKPEVVVSDDDMIHNEAFCSDFFNPSVPKQIVRVKLADLKTYVRIRPWTGSYNKFEGEDDVTIIGKHKLVTGSMANLTKRTTFIFKDFIFKAYGHNCSTHLLIPYVLVLCEERTFVFRPVNSTFSHKYYKEAYPLMSIALVSERLNWKHLLIMQYFPGRGNVFYERTVNFEALNYLSLGVHKRHLKDLHAAQEAYHFRYLTIDDRKAILSKDPTPEGKTQFNGNLALIQWSTKLTIFNLSSVDYSVHPGTDLHFDKWNLTEIKGRDKEWCKFPKNAIAYDSPELVIKPKNESILPETETPNPWKLISDQSFDQSVIQQIEEETVESHSQTITIFIVFFVAIVLGLLIVFATHKRRTDKTKFLKMLESLRKKIPKEKPKSTSGSITSLTTISSVASSSSLESSPEVLPEKPKTMPFVTEAERRKSRSSSTGRRSGRRKSVMVMRQKAYPKKQEKGAFKLIRTETTLKMSKISIDSKSIERSKETKNFEKTAKLEPRKE